MLTRLFHRLDERNERGRERQTRAKGDPGGGKVTLFNKARSSAGSVVW